MQSFDFSGRSVFVAGGTNGINLGIAEAFASAGAKVAVLGRSPERLSEAERRLRAFGGMVLGFSADVRNAEATAEALEAAHEGFGPLDVIVSGAAGNFPATAIGMSANGF